MQLAGGENNAWTNNDLTNYYITIPKSNVETAFWLESDRMLGLALTEQSVKVQKEVVIEEFKQQHLNRPYGDVQHLIRALAYKVHPYRWPTIGITPQHIEQATRDSIMQFYHRYYTPGNAILSVVGNISFDEVVQMAEKWFGSIENKAMPSSTCRYIHTPLMEPEQKRMRRKTVYRHVPSDMLIMAFHMSDRYQQEYHVCDLITDILSAGQSSRLIQRLINTSKLFTSLDAYIQGSLDAGLLYIMGRLSDGVTFEEAEQAVWHELDTLKRVAVPDEELNKVRNRSESERTFNNISYLNRAINLAQLELIGQDPTLEDELTRYCSVTAEDIKHTSRKIFTKKNCSVLYYKKR